MKIKTQILRLEDFDIIIRNENISEGDLYLVRGSYRIERNTGDAKIEKTINKYRKVIASTNPEHNLPSIDNTHLNLFLKFKLFDIEIEEEGEIGNYRSVLYSRKAKITDNKVKITKIL